MERLTSASHTAPRGCLGRGTWLAQPSLVVVLETATHQRSGASLNRCSPVPDVVWGSLEVCYPAYQVVRKLHTVGGGKLTLVSSSTPALVQMCAMCETMYRNTGAMFSAKRIVQLTNANLKKEKPAASRHGIWGSVQYRHSLQCSYTQRFQEKLYNGFWVELVAAEVRNIFAEAYW